jgi:hypothetical protein
VNITVSWRHSASGLPGWLGRRGRRRCRGGSRSFAKIVDRLQYLQSMTEGVAETWLKKLGMA